MSSPREKLQVLLRELFQFGSADLDFGIYRIMNFKRDVIEQFIEQDLIEAVDKELASGVLASQSQTALALKEAVAQVHENLGEEALDADGNLREAYHGTRIGQRYLELRARALDAHERPTFEALILNHLYAFFGRYYDNGDFLSKRRYSRREKYAIPYNGEEVYLHWANNDQYYVKTGEYFNDYRFRSPYGISVHFRLVAVDVEKDNVKGDKRLFIPLSDQVTYDAEQKEITIPFQYRPLTIQEEKQYRQRDQQKDIISAAVAAIPAKLQGDADALRALVSAHHTAADGEVSYLEHHLRQYTGRNTSDFFIHKDLKRFLLRELDFYLKNEVLSLDEIEAAGETRSESWFQIMRVIKSIGGRVIEFLAQIENFQRRLFEKRKFILETQYCVTMASVPEDLHTEIAECEAQWQEWKELLHLDDDQPDLYTAGAEKRSGLRIAALNKHPTLVLDTKHFDWQFRDRLLASYDDLDEITDGLLIHAENFQALTLMQAAYREKVNCVYIDPPFNSKTTEILYKNSYKHSSWLSLMQDRILAAKRLLEAQGVFICAVDENEQERLGMLLGLSFPTHDKTCVTVIHNPGGIQGENFSYCHEYAYFVFPTGGRYIGRIQRDEGDIRPLRDWGGEESTRQTARNCFYPIYVRNEEIVGFGEVCSDDFHPGASSIHNEDGTTSVYPVDSHGVERKWRYARQSVERIRDDLFVEEIQGERVIRMRKSIYRYKTVWTDRKYNSNAYGSRLLSKMFGEDMSKKVSFPKSIHNVKDCIDATTQNTENATIADYFAGSGTTAHAVINLNREDAGSRKFLLVEMEEYFDTVMLPRIKKAIYAPEWQEGKPKRAVTTEEAGRSPRIVKYIRLESYEDALNNITFSDAPKTLYDFDDYLLKYMLAWGTRESETLLSVGKLASPFSYKLTITGGEEVREEQVDIPETFAYLLGLTVKTRGVFQDGDRYYLVYRGSIDHREIAVIWRETAGWEKRDYERDKDFVEEQGLTEGADEVFVNGDSCIPKARALESVFKSRMFGSL